jgi:hypothetical protein
MGRVLQYIAKRVTLPKEEGVPLVRGTISWRGQVEVWRGLVTSPTCSSIKHGKLCRLGEGRAPPLKREASPFGMRHLSRERCAPPFGAHAPKNHTCHKIVFDQ